MTAHFAACVARFRNPAREVCGAGFLVGPRHVMTCAHVVNAVLGRDRQCRDRPDGVFTVAFPLAGVAAAKAEIAEWHPPVAYADRNADKPTDFAVLRLIAAISAPVARLIQGRVRWGREVRTFGFPVEHGQPADAETMAEDASGWISFRPVKDYGHLIKPGFSGAPAFAADSDTVIGMITAVQTGDDSRVAYGEPIRRLQLAWPPLARPYKGLARFDPDDADFFFGREAVSDDLLRRIAVDPVTLVVGASGGGKSSLVYGGVLPKLEAGSRVASFRPGSEPLEALAWALAGLIVPPNDPGRLMDRAGEIRRALQQTTNAVFECARALKQSLGARLLLVADQFEELFTLCRDEGEREAFIKVVTDIAGSRAPVALVATLRADFVGEVLRVAALAKALDGRYLMLRAMSGDELGRAIKGPASMLGVAFESGVDDLLLAAVAKDATALPLMEFALERLWAEQKTRRLTRDCYDGMGGLEGALAQHADDIVHSMSEAEQEDVRRLLCRLVHVVRPGMGEDTKRPRSRQELGEQLWSVARRLSGQNDGEGTQRPARLLVLYRDEQQREVADIIHEALIRQWPLLQGWLNGERDQLLFIDELQSMRRRWEDGHLAERLLRGRDLELASDRREWLFAEHPELRAFVEASVENAVQERATREADALWEPLEFRESVVSVRENEALLRLARADDDVRRAFLRRLCELPERARRFCLMSAPMVRAVLGLRQDQAALVQGVLACGLGAETSPDIVAATFLLVALGGIDDAGADAALDAAYGDGRLGGEVARQVGDWPYALVACGHRAHTSLALACVLDAIGQTTNPYQHRRFAEAAQALRAVGARADADRASRALDSVLYAIGKSISIDHLDAHWQAAQALAAGVAADRADHALDSVLDSIGETTDSHRLGALGRAAQGLAATGARVDVERAGRALDCMLDAIGQSSSRNNLKELGHAVQAVAAAVDTARAALALDRVLDAIDQTTDSDQLRALGQAAYALAAAGVRVDLNRADRALKRVLDAIGENKDFNQFEAFGRAARALAAAGARAEADSVGRALDRVLEAIGQTTSLDALQPLGQAAQALAAAIDTDRAGRALDRVMDAIDQIRDSDQLEALGRGAQALAARVDADSASHALDRVLDALDTWPPAIGWFAQAAQAFAAAVDADCACRALGRVLDAIEQNTRPYVLSQLAQAAQAFAAAGGRVVDADRRGRALNRVLHIIGQTTSHYKLAQLGQAAQALVAAGAQVDADSAGCAFDRVLDAIGQTTDANQLEAIGQAAQALAAVGPIEWTTFQFVKALRTPTAAQRGVDAMLVAALRLRHPDMPTAEQGFWAAIEWLREHYPDIDFDAPP